MGCASSTQEVKAHRAFEAVPDTDAYASVSEILQRSENKSMASVHTSDASASTRWHAFPTSAFRLRYGQVTQRGQYPDAPNRENQDRSVVHLPYGGNAEQALFGVFDGHGENGTQCASFAAFKISQGLALDSSFVTSPEVAARNVCTRTNDELHMSDIDDSMSGTTAILALIRGTQLVVANVGDSRAVLAERNGHQLIAKDLSWDQTPMRPDECARVKSAGARVLSLEQLHGTKDSSVQEWSSKEEASGCAPRLWSPHGKFPGAAFSRSIGDAVAEEIGVTAQPELHTQRLTSLHPFFIIASDGLWEFVPSQSAVDIAMQCDDPQDAANALVAEAQRRWLRADTRMDDITVIVVQLMGIGGGLASGNCAVASGDLALLSTQRSGADAPRFIESTEIGATPTTHTPLPLRGFASGVGIRGSRMGSKGSAGGTGRVGQFAAAAAKSTVLSSAFDELIDIWKLDDDVRRELQDCVQRCDYQQGDVVVEQGEAGFGSCILEVGKLDLVIATSRGKLGGKRTLAHSFVATQDRMPTFMHLGVFAAQARAVSIVARAPCIIWLLERSATRAVLGKRAWDALPYLRRVHLLACMSLGQLDRVVVWMRAKEFAPNETLVKRGGDSVFGIVAHGEVHCELGDPPMHISLTEGDYFGELALQGPSKSASSLRTGKSGAWAMSLVEEEFTNCCGPLKELISQDQDWKQLHARAAEAVASDMPTILDVLLEDCIVRTVFVRGACQMVVQLEVPSASSIEVVTARVFNADASVALGHNALISRQREISRQLGPSVFVPMTGCTLRSQGACAEVLVTSGSATLSQLLVSAPLDVASTQFLIAGMILGLEELHRNQIVYRGLSAPALLITHAGYPQLADLRFAKSVTARTFTVCGAPEYIAPEAIRLVGHTDSVDWWALGVLLFRMLAGFSPFYEEGDSEITVFKNVLHSTVMYPQHFSAEVCDLLDGLLDRCPETRIPCGKGGYMALKNHAFFKGISWERLAQKEVMPPPALMERLENCTPLPPVTINHTLAGSKRPSWMDEF